MVLQQSFVAALSFRSNVDCRCLQPLCRSLYLRMLVSQLLCNVFFSCLSRYSCFPFFSCSQPLCLLPCHPQLFCSFFFAAFFTVLIAAFFLLPNLSPQLSCFSLGHRQPFRSFFFAAFSPAVLHVVIFHLQPPLPLPPKPITAAVLLSPWTPAAVLQLCLCSLLRSCFACCDVSSAVSFSSSQHATAAVLQLFLQPFTQLFCMLQSLFLPPNLSLQLFCSILGHRQPFCRAFPAAFSAAVLHVVIYYLQPPFFLPTLHRSCFAFSWSPAAVLQLFLCSLRQLF